MSASDELWLQIRGMSLKTKVIATSIPYVGGFFMFFLLILKLFLYQVKCKKYMVPFRCFFGFLISVAVMMIIYNQAIAIYFVGEFNSIVGLYYIGFLSLLWQHKYLDKKTALYYKEREQSKIE